MNHVAQVSRSARRRPSRRDVPPARMGYILAVSGALAAVTFTLVYLATFAYMPGF